MLESMAISPISEVETRTVVAVDQDMSVAEVMDAMLAQKRGVAVVLGDGRIVGIFTERTALCLAREGRLDWGSMRIADAMGRGPTTMCHTGSIAEALRHMRGGDFRYLPVVDDDLHVKAVVSARDILAHLAAAFPEEYLNLPPEPSLEARGRWGG
jgi:CBS domain-containing protein